MDFRILGSLEAVGGAGGAAVDLGPPKQRALLAILLLHAGEIVPVDRLIDSLWPERPPRTAAHSIQIYISELRRTLAPFAGGEFIVTRQPGYQLQAPGETIDARRFERLVEDGMRQLQAGDRPAGTAMLRSALVLWRGPALSDFAYDEFAQPYIRRLNDRHLDAIEELAGAELAAGLIADALPLVEAAIREDPLRERSREILMLALYRSGRHAEALRTYQRLRDLLVEELGLDPSPALQRLQQRILLHDPTLSPAVNDSSVVTRARNPYKGLRSFTEEDAADFFGRDALVERLLDALRAGDRLVSLVGPSGSGKSSVVRAGLIPRLRAGAIPGSDGWAIASLVIGEDPLGEVEAAIAAARLRTSPAGKHGGLAHDARDLDAVAEPGRQAAPVLLVIDQFEDLFSVADEDARRRLLHLLTERLTRAGGSLAVILTLRADFYDRPLLDPEFAAVFIPGVMNVLPMTTHELEAAVVGPAKRSGASVEPLLLVELVADTAAQPGALPLLQFALTELFDRSPDGTLTLADYRALGGLRGILSRRAESLYGELSDAERQVAKQVFLRLVRPGRGTIDSRRRIPLSDLTDLDVDPVALSAVLDAFARHRLLSFDREPTTGDATVEVAHEALLREWDRMAGWIDRHRAALRRHDAFNAGAEEWESSGRNPDYLVTGSRLDEFEATVLEGTLQLTGRERAFLEASLDRRRTEGALEVARSESHQRLERRARSRSLALGAAVLALAVVGGYAVLGSTGSRRAPVAFLYNGDGVFEATLIVQHGFEGAVSDFGLTSRKTSVSDGPTADAALRKLSADGAGLIVVTAVDTNIDAVATDFPATRYVTIDLPSDRANVTRLSFAANEGSFLAGVAAAARSRTGTIGFIGGMDGPVIWPFEAGYEAGARAVDPTIRILATYLSPLGDYNGYADPAAAAKAAGLQFDAGADIIFGAAGDSDLGVFQAATAKSVTAGRQLWAIGVDSDQYQTVGDDPANVDWEAWQRHILTSMVKRADTGVYAVLSDYARGSSTSGTRILGLAAHGVDISYSGGYIDSLRPMIDAWRAKIVAGQIVLPCIPAGREARARTMGLKPASCGG
jgi:basic membrane lipoprotein Med (substrate-binding protein (PBP1-ABC) superfamily)/DNA-binding SARP family transcriptional activator